MTCSDIDLNYAEKSYWIEF